MSKKNDLVVHHNYLNESIFNFSELELNLFVVIIYKMREEIENSVVFKAQDIKKMVNSKDRSYKKFESVIHSLQDRTINIKTGNGYKRIKPFPTLYFDNVEKTVEVDTNKNLVPFFRELKEQFTKYSLKEFLTLRSKHSKRLYQLLKQYEGIGKRTFEVEELKKLLECNTDSYSRMYNFEKRVLKTTKNDINNNTTLKIDYHKIRVGKAIGRIEFHIKKESQKTTKNDKTILVAETRKDVIDRALKLYKKKYIKDLNEQEKRMLDLSLKTRGFKLTAKRRGEKKLKSKKII